MRRLWIMAWVAAALSTGCGNGSQTITGAGSTGTTGTGTGTGTTTTVVSLGSGSGASFQSGVIAISTASLSAGGSTSLQVSLVDQTGAPYTSASTITFSSPCQSTGLATIVATPASGTTPASPSVTTSTGSATATYSATGCSGSDVITASSTANGQNLTATGTVTVAQAAIGSIAFISATPASITLKGVGSVGGSATSTVVFEVLDTSGGPRAGATVTFALNSSVGGITIAPASAVTDANGQVQTIVSAGTVATTVRVTASTAANGSTISTESNALTVSTGIPTSANISLAVKCWNVEAFDQDGVTVPVTVSMTDRFSNPVPDGTTANFQTTLGGIQASCQTGATTPGSGQCSVNWVSKAPYVVNGNPATTAGTAHTNTAANWCSPTTNPYCNGTTNGRSPIIVTAIGEESFIDANGTGYFNPADTVPFDPSDKDNDFASGVGKPWFDTSDPFLNEWELYDTYGTPTYVLGEPFLDFFNKGVWQGPDGLVESALCQGPLCNTTNSSVAIYQSNVIIVSGHTAYFTLVSGSPPYTLPATISMYIYDGRYQQMPAGTTVAVSFTANSGTLSSPTPPAWACSNAPPVFDAGGNVVSAGQRFDFTATPPTSGAVAGTMFVTVTTPGGIVSTFNIAVTN
jgi:hypothetical protein